MRHRRTSAGARLIGNPASIQASTPPIMSVALRRPMDLRLSAAKLELKPWRHISTSSVSYDVASGIRDSDLGSSRHSNTVRSMTMAPGISPWFSRWQAVRVSMRSAPDRDCANVSCAESRLNVARTALSRASTPDPPASFKASSSTLYTRNSDWRHQGASRPFRPDEYACRNRQQWPA